MAQRLRYTAAPLLPHGFTMARPFKIFLAICAALLLLLVAALTAAVMLFDPNDYRGQISKLVKDKTGRDLAIGEIGLSVFPWVKVNLETVSLSNAPGFGAEPFAQVAHAGVGVKLLPLLRDNKIMVDGIRLEGLKLNLAKAADGKTNWADLARPADPAQAQPETEAQPEADAKASFRLEDIDVGGVSIVDAAINYRDEQTGQAYRIDDFDLETGALKPGEDFDIETSIRATLEAQKLDTEVKLSAHVSPDLKTQQVKLGDLKLEAKARSPTLEGETKLTGQMLGNLQTQLFEIEELDLQAKGKTAQLQGDGTLKAGVRADLKTRRFELRGLAVDASVGGAALPGGSQSLQLTGHVLVDQTAGTGEVRELILKASGLEASANLKGSGLAGDTPRFTGPFAIKPFNARELLGKFSKTPLVTADPQALTKLAVHAQLDATPRSARLDDLVFELDQSTATGSFAIRDFATAAIAFTLKLDQIDADRYLAPAPPRSPEKRKNAPAEDINKTQIPVEALENLNLDGTLDIGKLRLKGVNMSDVRLRIEGPKGAAKQAQLNARLYGGQFTANTRIAPGARPSYALKTSLQSITLGPLLKDFMGNDKLSGLGTVNLDITTAGSTVGDVRRALNGDVSLSFQNGAVKGFNLGEMLRRAQAALKGTPYSGGAEPQETDFAVINFKGQLVNGVLKSDSLDARNPLLRVAGKGEIDLANETFNYLAKPTVVETSKGQGGKGLEELGGLTIPVRLTGTFTAPKYKVEISDVVRDKAKEKLKAELKDKEDELKEKYKVDERKEELKQKLDQKLNEKLGTGLEGLFGSRKKKQEPAPTEQPQTEPPPEEQQKEEGAPAAP